MPTFNIHDFGAAGDAVTPDTRAIQAAIDACHTAGGGLVVVPAGRKYLTGTVALKSGVGLHVEGDATILASDRREDYPDESLPCLIAARGADRVSITGTGVIDGRAKAYVTEELPHIYRTALWRPRLIGLVGCTRVAVRDIAIRDAPFWSLHLIGCEDVLIHGITILNDLKMPNADGIDPDHCRRVRITDCYIEAGDDCIVLKNTAAFAWCGPCEDIAVSGCTLVSTSAAIKIGTESVDDFRRITVEGCTIRQSHRGVS